MTKQNEIKELEKKVLDLNNEVSLIGLFLIGFVLLVTVFIIISTFNMVNIKHLEKELSSIPNKVCENGTMIFGFRKLTNYENVADTYTINSAGITQLGILDSYEILYLVNDTQVPTITIDSPTNSTYLTNSVWMNVSLDEEGSMW